MNKTGLILGSFLGLFHAFWSILIFLGLAQPFLNFIFDLHMIDNPYHVQAFHLGKALALVAITFIFGYIFGYIISFLSNKIKQQ